MINDSSLKKFGDSYLFSFSYFFCFHLFLNRIHFWYFNLNFSDLIYLLYVCPKANHLWAIKGYLRYKMITFQNVPSKAQIKNFFIS